LNNEESEWTRVPGEIMMAGQINGIFLANFNLQDIFIGLRTPTGREE